jgi:ribosomal protein L29
MKRKELDATRSKTLSEMEQELHSLMARARVLKTDIATGKVKSLKEVRAVQRSIAQLNTLMGEKTRTQ